MSKLRYTIYNILIYLIFVIFYFYPGITTGKWVGEIIKGMSPFLLLLGVAVIQSLAAVLLFKYKKNVVKFLTKNEKKVANTKFWVIISLIFFVLYFGVGVKRYINLDTALYDFALEEQVIWNTSQGRLFQSGAEVENYLGDHVSILTLIPSFFYAFVPSPYTIIFIQVAAFFIGAFGVKKLADKTLKKPWLSVATYLMYVFYVGSTGPSVSDYRPVFLSLPFLAWGMYFMEDKKTFWKSALLFFFAALGKEDMALFVGTLGLYMLVFLKEKRALLIMLLGYGLAYLDLFVIIPYFRGDHSDTLDRYGGISTLFVSIDQKITYIVRLFFPFLFTPFLSPKKIWVLLPNLGINLLSNYSGQMSGLNQYDVATSLVIFWSFLDVVKTGKLKKNTYNWFSLLLIINTLLLSGHMLRRHLLSGLPRYNDYLYIQELKLRIPDDAIVAASQMPGGQFGQRKNLQIFDDTVMTYKDEADYIVVDKIREFSDATQLMINKRLENGYIIREETESFIVLQKIYFNF